MISLSARIKHLVFVNFLVSVERIAAQLPAAVEVETAEAGHSYLTVVFIEFSRVGLGALRLPAAPAMQLNLRTYVRYRGEPAIYFLWTYISGTFSLFGRMLRLPSGGLIARLNYQGGGEEGGRALSITGWAGREPIDVLFSTAGAQWGDRDLFMGYAHRSLGLIPVGRRWLMEVEARHGRLQLQPLLAEHIKLPLEGGRFVSGWGVEGSDFSFVWRGLRPSSYSV